MKCLLQTPFFKLCYFSRIIHLSYKMSHMRCQAPFSLKINLLSAAVAIGALSLTLCL